MWTIMTLRERIRRSVSRCILIRMVHRKPTRHLKRWMRPWLAFLIRRKDDSTIKWEMQTHFNKESPKEEEVTIITSIGATLRTLGIKNSYHPRNSSTLCSLASSQGAEIWGRSSKDNRDSNVDRLMVKSKKTWVSCSDKCFQCFSSSSSLYSQACSQAALFRTVRITITVCNALTITNSN